MSNKKKISILSRLRNYFLAGIVVLVPIGFTLYLTLFLIKISSKLLPSEINPNSYLPFSIPGLEILLSVLIIITPSPTGRLGEYCGLFLPLRIKHTLEASLPTDISVASSKCHAF